MIQPQKCLYIRNESVLERYEEEKLFDGWANKKDGDPELRIAQRHLVDVLPSSRKIYATYADGCCEVGKG